MVLEALNELDNKFEEVQKQKAKNLKDIVEVLSTFTIKVGDAEIDAKLCPSSLEKEMIEDLQNNKLAPLDYAKKYFPLWFGIEPEEVEQLSTITILELIKAYLEAYGALINRNFRTNRDGTK